MIIWFISITIAGFEVKLKAHTANNDEERWTHYLNRDGINQKNEVAKGYHELQENRLYKEMKRERLNVFNILNRTADYRTDWLKHLEKVVKSTFTITS